MISWSSAYRRLSGSSDFDLLFGRQYGMDAFRPYSYPLKFEGVSPALLALAATPNTGDLATTIANIAAPTTQVIAPGPAASKNIIFPAGAVILGITACAQVLQRTTGGFVYSQSASPGGLDLCMLDLEYTSGDTITAGNPIPESILNPNTVVQTAPPIMVDAIIGSASRSEGLLGRELWVTPGQGLRATIRSLLLPTSLPATGQSPPNQSFHLVFHAMVPGSVRVNKAGH